MTGLLNPAVPPFTLAMTICGLSGAVLTYGPGACQGFAMWSRADAGEKTEQTSLSPGTHRRLVAMLDQVATLRLERGHTARRRFQVEGNFYAPAV